MPADASIYSLLRPAAPMQGPMETFGQGLQLRHLLDQGDLAQLQRRKGEQELAYDEGVRQFYAGIKPGEDPRAKIADLLRVSPKAGMAVRGRVCSLAI